jgi:hypothetical protein
MWHQILLSPRGESKILRLRWRAVRVVVSLVCLIATPAWADGHSPAFAFSTAILGKGDASFETELMWRSGTVMFGPRVSYGISQNFQISVSSPFHINHGEHPTGRFTAMMPGNPEFEALLGWRFYHASTGIGTRNEATLYAGGSALTQHTPRVDGPALERQPGMYVAFAAGRVARSYDIWAGAGYQRYGEWNRNNPVNSHQSNTLLGSFAAGWRPSFLNKDYPKPDLRFFWETTGEHVGLAWRDRTPGFGGGGGHGHLVPPTPLPSQNGIIYLRNSGGKAVFSGPSFLCTYRSVAVQGGVLFAVMDQPNGRQPQYREELRVVVGVSYYFLGRRK